MRLVKQTHMNTIMLLVNSTSPFDWGVKYCEWNTYSATCHCGSMYRWARSIRMLLAKWKRLGRCSFRYGLIGWFDIRHLEKKQRSLIWEDRLQDVDKSWVSRNRKRNISWPFNWLIIQPLYQTRLTLEVKHLGNYFIWVFYINDIV